MPTVTDPPAFATVGFMELAPLFDACTLTKGGCGGDAGGSTSTGKGLTASVAYIIQMIDFKNNHFDFKVPYLPAKLQQMRKLKETSL